MCPDVVGGDSVGVGVQVGGQHSHQPRLSRLQRDQHLSTDLMNLMREKIARHFLLAHADSIDGFVFEFVLSVCEMLNYFIYIS